MRRQADAAAHHQAIHVGDVGLWERGNARVHDVFLAPEHLAEIAADLGAFIEPANITAGAEPAFSCAFENDESDIRICLELIERRVDPERHLQSHRVDRLRAIEPDDSGRALAANDEIALLRSRRRFRHRASSISLRDTISRMISLVPSRIWCTRKSRTIFSMPYSLK